MLDTYFCRMMDIISFQTYQIHPVMKKALFTLFGLALFVATASAQIIFAEQIEAPADFGQFTLVVPKSPLSVQILFIGGTDMVQTNATYGNPAGETPAKEYHDFIGFTEDKTTDDLGWISVNHEMAQSHDLIGDGGGMTVFKVRRDPITDTLIVVEQILTDGRKGKFFAVDFANTVGETGMNCGGIQSPDGRIWTAEEWMVSSNTEIYNKGEGFRDTLDFVVKSDLMGWEGVTLKKYQNLNWMVEIDPRQATAIRKQYNWGRQPFESGTITNDLKRVYLGTDATPGFFTMFIADQAGDFSKGMLYAYKHDNQGYKWIPISGDTETLMNVMDTIAAKGATMFNRIEWLKCDPFTNDIYFTETGSDYPGMAFEEGTKAGAVHDTYRFEHAAEQGFSSPDTSEYTDYYGRVWKYDAAKDTAYVYLEAGAGVKTNKHFSNPDGMNIIVLNGKRYMIIEEDLNGRSQGRMPAGFEHVNNCEIWMLDMSIPNPTTDDLIRLAITPIGAEVTGVALTPDGKSLLVNAQHPASSNPFPNNHSYTFAIHGFDKLTDADLLEPIDDFTDKEVNDNLFRVHFNATTRMVYFNQTTDAAVYDQSGKRVIVVRNAKTMDASILSAGKYIIENEQGSKVSFIIE